MELDDTAVGQLVRKYDANEHRLEDMHKSFNTVVQQLAALNEMVSTQRINVEVTEAEFRASFGNTTVPRTLLESLVSCLEELRVATDQKRRVKSCLQQAGLGRFIQKQQTDS